MFPRVKSMAKTGENFPLCSLRLHNAPLAADNVIKSFIYDFSLPITVNGESAPCMSVDFKMIGGSGEGYSLTIKKGKAEIICESEEGARNAAATFVYLLDAEGDTVTVPGCTIEDEPDSGYRSMLLDLARRYWPVEKVYALIRRLAYLKYNRLHMHLLDGDGYAVESKAVPELWKNTIMCTYTLEEMRGIIKYACDFGIVVVPELDMPGHGLAATRNIPGLHCDCAGDSGWAWCVGSEESYRVAEKLIAEIAQISPGEYIHMGGDELAFRDLKKLGFWPAWDRCPRCTALAKEKGYESEVDMYYHFLLRIYDIVKKYGKKLMIWNDWVDISKSPDLPRDILIHFWRIADPNRGPYIGCTPDRFLEEGFTVVNSYYPETYCDTYLEEEKLRTWYPKGRPFGPETDRKNVIGGEICAWGDVDHFDYSLYTALPLFADRLWNDAPLDADAEETGFTLMRQQIGPQKYRHNIFAMLGGCLIPTSGARYYNEIQHEQVPEAQDALCELTDARRKFRNNAAAIDQFRKSIKAYIGTEKME